MTDASMIRLCTPPPPAHPCCHSWRRVPCHNCSMQESQGSACMCTQPRDMEALFVGADCIQLL